MNKRTMALTAGLLLAMSGVAGCSGPVDSSEAICDTFAQYAKDGQPADQRAEVVSTIGDQIGDAAPLLQDNYAVLTRTVDANESAWRLGADVFAKTCFDIGWNG